MKVIKSIVLAIGAIIAFPFIIIGVALGVIVASAKAVVKSGVSMKPISPTSTGHPATSDVQSKSPDVKIVNFNKFPFGREDKGGTA